jgi:hypothetical protein
MRKDELSLLPMRDAMVTVAEAASFEPTKPSRSLTFATL